MPVPRRSLSPVEPPDDAEERRRAKPVICYPSTAAMLPDLGAMRARRSRLVEGSTCTVPPRDALCFSVPKGGAFRIVSVEGPQVGDLNLWSAADLSERFYSGKTRALHGSHVSVGDRLWSGFPFLRPMATVIEDSLAWYGFDADGASVHDVIGTRCDPYTARLLTGSDYDRCCHSNLVRALASEAGLDVRDAEPHVHDVLNVFMCTGFEHGSGRYFMKASPVRPGDFIEFFAEIDLLGALSTCPGGDCGTAHSSDEARCHPLRIDVFMPEEGEPDWPEPRVSGYSGGHGG